MLMIVTRAVAVDIVFVSRKFAEQCKSQKLRLRHFGAVRGKLIGQRLDELRAAATLEDMRYVRRARCHELKGNRAGQLSVDLDHPYRLLFEAVDSLGNTVPRRSLDWTQVTIVRILGVEDTHE